MRNESDGEDDGAPGKQQKPPSAGQPKQTVALPKPEELVLLPITLENEASGFST